MNNDTKVKPYLKHKKMYSSGYLLYKDNFWNECF